MTNFEKVKTYLAELGFVVEKEIAAEEIVIISDEKRGLNHFIIDCEGSLLVMEQHIFDLPKADFKTLKRLMQMSRRIVHGAFVLDDSGRKVLFRDTLELETLDLRELEASINSLGFALAENAEELIEFSNDED